MKKILTLGLLIIMTIFMTTGTVQAKWWIFGKSADEVILKYVYINGCSTDEAGGQMTIFADTLKDGQVNIKGKASAGKSTVAVVEISIDNKETWNKTKVSDKGDFEYSFNPDLTKTYDIYITATDTAGKTNVIDDSHITVSFSTKDISGNIKLALVNIFKAYENKNTFEFMKQVSDKFIPDVSVLDSAIRKDFLSFDYIKIAYFINSIVQAQDGKTIVSIMYNRSVISTKSGNTLTDTGITEMTFASEADTFNLYSMKYPLMFGLSEAAELSEGTINQDSESGTLVLDYKGEAKLLPFNKAKNFDDSDEPDENTVILNGGDGYDFKNEELVVSSSSNSMIGFWSSPDTPDSQKLPIGPDGGWGWHTLFPSKNLGPGSVSSKDFPSVYDEGLYFVNYNDTVNCYALDYRGHGYGELIVKIIRKPNDHTIVFEYKWR